MKFRITLTWSKVIALVILVFAFIIDRELKQNGTFMFSLPFVVAMITGKQLIGIKKAEKK